ncbi:MAG: phenylacetate-CoA oxygenase subunit PaaJ [Albidovulum sp.]|nr:phenylacetate-CoA oxygenase subunit PaaJ [Albidovulum sp.]MDE0307267.1 phenylacetate-CoA oxygenase subunit PaaJ [Albidovulum sp.]MDE0532259.1 phenylacetate-CoA oxygenase subunit PaaJ [Albidovulum sp.]
MAESRDERAREAWDAAASVVDPEIPCVTVVDLGILRDVRVENSTAVASLTPTYSGCPAQFAIEHAVKEALQKKGFHAKIRRVLDPPWTTDWITREGREKLRLEGIAPPGHVSENSRELFQNRRVACPRCGSEKSERLSEFGSTACKAQYRCLACTEPFEYFKCI